MSNPEKTVEIVYKGVVFYFRTDRNGMLWLETDGHPTDRKPNVSNSAGVLMEIKRYLITGQNEDDKEYQEILRTPRRER